MASSPIAPLGLALVGFGKLAEEVHAPLLRRLRSIDLKAIADPLLGNRTKAGRLFPEARICASLDEILEVAKIEAVIIASPPSTHADLAVAAIRNGKHVYLEKPMSVSVADALRVVDAWKGSGLIGMMGFNYRLARQVQTVRAQLLANRVGPLRFVQTVFSGPAKISPEWRAVRAMGGGVLLDLGSHHLDLIRYLFDAEIEDVHARIWSERTEDDCAALQIRTTTGRTIQSSFSFCGAEEDVIRIFGEAGSLTIDRYGQEEAQFASARRGKGRIEGLAASLRSLVPTTRTWKKWKSPWHEPSFAAALTMFVDAVRGGRSRDLPDFMAGLLCQKVIAAAEESARTGHVTKCSGRVL